MATSVVVDDAGSDRPWLVMVHGMSQDHRVFDRQVEAFRGTHRILLVDLPGHGLASAVDGPYGHMEFAAHVTSVLDDRDVASADYWGTHTGAAIGLLIASRQPRRFRALALEGALMPGENVPVVTQELDRAKRLARGESVEAAREAWWDGSCWFDVMKSDPVACRAEAHRAMVFDFPGRPWTDERGPGAVENAAPALSRLSISVLLFNGAGDHPDFLNAAERLAALLPAARRALVPDTGGFPAWERPEAVNAMVAAFLAAEDNPET